MDSLADRIDPELKAKVLAHDDAVRKIHDGMTLAVSGFTKSGEPKVVLPALARHFAAQAPDARIDLYSGASLSEEVEGPLAPYLRKRAPYMSSAATRKLILGGKIEYFDVHLSQFARQLGQGFYGPIDLAVIEASRVSKNGEVVLTSSVGISAEALAGAKQVILEVNVAEPDYSGFHDILLPPRPPKAADPVSIRAVNDRVGQRTARVDVDRVVAIVESRTPGHGVAFAPTEVIHERIADHLVAFLIACRERFGWGEWLPPLQSGVGNVANAVIAALYRSPFSRMRFWTEVFQDGMLRFVSDEDKFAGASATGLSFSAKGYEAFLNQFARCKELVVLRPMWISNSPELITRLFVVAMNTPLEVDMYGHVNSTHAGGSRVVNGVGGSGDFFRNGYLSIAHTPSFRRLKDGQVVSCVMPYLTHVDHTAHDIKCVVTEQGYADLTSIQSSTHRARLIIDHCAHPHFRPLLRSYLKLADAGDEPHVSNLDHLQGWWRDYTAACHSFSELA